MELAPFHTTEQRYWREQKGRSKLPVMEPNGLVALIQNSSIDSDILTRFSSVSDIGKPWVRIDRLARLGGVPINVNVEADEQS